MWNCWKIGRCLSSPSTPFPFHPLLSLSLSPHPFLTSLSSPPFPLSLPLHSTLFPPYSISAFPFHSFPSYSISAFPFHSFLSYSILFFTDFYWVLTHYTVQLQYWELGRAGTRTPAASVEAWCNCLLSSWELDLLCWPSPSRGGHYAATESLLSGGIDAIPPPAIPQI